MLQQSESDHAEENLLDVELREDGGIRVVMGRMTAVWGSDPLPVILDGLAVAYARRLVHWATGMGDAIDYRGSWVLGLAATRLRSFRSAVWRQGMYAGGGNVTYDADEYREVTTSSYVEMTKEPWAVADRLVGRLLRGLGTQRIYGEALAPRVTFSED